MSTIPHFTTLGAGPTILMLHGMGGGHLMFAPQVETFASLGYRAVAWDMPGYGRSAPIEPYTFKGLAQRCAALIENLVHARRGSSVILLGHGMGGMVAQELVARRPELASRLILCGSLAAFGQGDADWQRSFIARRTAPLDGGQSMAELAQTLVPQMIGPAALPEGVRLATQCMGQVNPSTYRRALQALPSFDRQASLP
ncbi:MAG: alpha/beta fold hydrolase, partial [Burkholderiaceae bacterium]